MKVKRKKIELWKIALICHTMLVAITLADVLYNWKASSGECAIVWLFVAIIDIPAAIAFLLLDEIAAESGFSGHFRYTYLPFAVFTVVGGAQWFMIFHRSKPPSELECVECGYDLRASQGVGRCPECGTPIAKEVG
ncbi:MAG: hypothetical protein DHS20C16_26990 [Phycisphaerae bacterium]|nr:MAG: hypothetical protein DHS20C16_26990 [Phycisphaerae bacterium]